MDDSKKKPVAAKKVANRSKGGAARAESLSSDERKAIAKKAAVARWGEKPYRVTHKGSFFDEFGIDVDCYVLDDQKKTAVISQRGMGLAIGLKGGSGRAFPDFAKGKTIASVLGADLLEKIDNPLIFKATPLGAGTPEQDVHGYDVTLLIDVCHALVDAASTGRLLTSQADVARQAQVIINASAKSGIQGLVYALAGFDRTKEEVISAFKAFVQEEARKYEQEFPSELYMEWHRLYQLPVPVRGKPWQLRHLTVKHVYYPLAKSNGKILDLIRALKSQDGDRQKKLFQFLNDVGTRALRMHMGRVLEMAESSKTKEQYEAKIIDRFGGQQELDLAGDPS
ncbi:P63C domain-containing protein [Paraburkholderia bannensis]|uniref:P63C domain-containing protein n=1 Tax=Paraburkholderia bannensis TaxID=765414 RepID=UPI002AB62FEB|nr:P63C domain-containing protein [Paraburkholderia bannensis]